MACGAVGALAQHLHFGRLGQHGGYPRAGQRFVVDDENAQNHRSPRIAVRGRPGASRQGRRARAKKPPSGGAPIWSVPPPAPSSLSRARVFPSPTPSVKGFPRARPRPLSAISSKSQSPSRRAETRTTPGFNWPSIPWRMAFFHQRLQDQHRHKRLQGGRLNLLVNAKPLAKPGAFDLQVTVEQFEFLFQGAFLPFGGLKGAAQQSAQGADHVIGLARVLVHQGGDRVEGC